MNCSAAHKVSRWVNLQSVLLLFNHTSCYFWCNHFQLPASPSLVKPQASCKRINIASEDDKLLFNYGNQRNYTYTPVIMLMIMSDHFYLISFRKLLQCTSRKRRLDRCYFKIGTNFRIRASENKNDFWNKDLKLQSNCLDHLWDTCRDIQPQLNLNVQLIVTKIQL